METSMEFVEKMHEAMVAMAEACKLNPTWRNCQYCPFDTYCDVLTHAQYECPADEGWI